MGVQATKPYENEEETSSMYDGEYYTVSCSKRQYTCMQLVAALFAEISSDSADEFLDRTVLALRRLSTTIPIFDVNRTNVGVYFRWHSFDAEEQHFDLMKGKQRKKVGVHHLRGLECLGYALLSRDAYFANQIPSATPQQYEQWTSGVGKLPSLPSPTTRMWSTPVAFLFPMLECLRQVSGPVGLVWLVPMLFLLAGDDLDLARDYVITKVPCPPEQRFQTHTHKPTQICSKLQAGCLMEIHEHVAHSWTLYKPLVRFCAYHQCQMLVGGLHDERRQWEQRQDHFGSMDASDHLVICTIGGVPMGTMAYNSDNGNNLLYISTLCSVNKHA